MRRKMLCAVCTLGMMSLVALVSCSPRPGGANQTPGQQSPFQQGYILTRCDGQAVPTATAAPPSAPMSAYVGAVSTHDLEGYLYAFAPNDGSARWQQAGIPQMTPPALG